VQASTEVSVFFFDPVQRAFHSGLVAVPYGSSSMDSAVRWMSEAARDSLRYIASKPSELDQPLEVTGGKIFVMADSDGKPAEGVCVVEFYVNHRGEVRLPRIVESDNDQVSQSALLTLRELRYTPVTTKGRPTYVKVRQPMQFHP
jgi:TonB family protein